MSIKKTAFLVVLLVGLAFAVSASAQTNESSKFGVQVSFGPQWQMLPQVKDLFSSEIDLTGREFRVGLIVRGRTLSGDWGVSYIHNTIDSSSAIREFDDYCGGYPASEYRCYPTGTTYRLNKVSFDGLEVHKYVPFVTIAERAQIGVNIVGGAVWVKGSAEKSVITLREVNELPVRSYYVSKETVSTITAADAFKDNDAPTTLPTIRAEAVIAVIVAQGLKVKASIGLIGVPGCSRFNIGATYLF